MFEFGNERLDGIPDHNPAFGLVEVPLVQEEQIQKGVPAMLRAPVCGLNSPLRE
jgi:hypothetical protein